MKTKILLLLFALGTLIFSSCGKDKAGLLTSKSWKWGMTDKNPSSNPPGRVLYKAVRDCEKDDRLKFGKNGKLTLSRNQDKCSSNEAEQEVYDYSVDRAQKRITIDGFNYILLEESKSQIKYYSPMSSQSGYDYQIYLLQ